MQFLVRRPIPGRNTRGTFAICAASLRKRPSATNVRSAFALRRSPEKNTKSRATRGHIGNRRLGSTNKRRSVEPFLKHASGLNAGRVLTCSPVESVKVVRLQVVLCFYFCLARVAEWQTLRT